MTPLLLPRKRAEDEPELLYRLKADSDGKILIQDGLSLQLAVLLALGMDSMKRAAETNQLPSAGLADSVHATLYLGLVSGITLAEDQLSIADISINRHHVGAMQNQWVDSTTLATIALVNATSSRLVVEGLREMQEGGHSFAWLEERLMEVFGADRAERISTTEVTRGFTWGAIAAYLMASVGYVMWVTQNDEATCKICQPLHRQIRPIGEGFGLIGFPPAHPNCRCYLSPVI